MIKQYSREVHTAGRGDKLQLLDRSSTATRISNSGVTRITSTAAGSADHIFKIAAPAIGIRKTIVVSVESTRTVVVQQASTTVTLYGSTLGTITFSTGAGKRRHIELIGLTATSYAVTSQSTGITFSA